MNTLSTSRWNVLPARAGGQRGALLMEIVIGILVFTVVGTAVLAGLSSVQLSSADTRSQAIAESIARNQMERVVAGAFPTLPYTYSGGELVSTPADYSVSADALEYQPGAPGIARVTVNVSFFGSTMLTLESLWFKDSP